MAITGMIASSRMIAIALARPGCPKSYSCLIIWNATTWVSKLPLVMTYTMSNVLRAVMIIVVVTTAIVGASSGRVMPRNTWRSVAPSTRAASSSSGLMPLSAADRMTIAKPVHIQAITTTSRIVLIA